MAAKKVRDARDLKELLNAKPYLVNSLASAETLDEAAGIKGGDPWVKNPQALLSEAQALPDLAPADYN